MKNRKRINVSVDESQYEKLRTIQEVYGFKNVCELTRALLNIVTQYIDAGVRRKAAAPVSDADDILEMFNELADWEATPSNVQPPARHRKTKD